MGFAIMRIEKIKSVAAGNARLKHNRRQIRCPTSNPDKKNVSLILAEHMRKNGHKSFREIFHQCVKGQKIRSNAVMALEVVLTFSPGAISENGLQNWAIDNAKWLRETFGESNVIDCQLHLDEKTPHIHAMIIPLDDRGKLNARCYVGGTRHKLSLIQSDYARAMQIHGLERGICRELTKKRHESSLRWHQRQAEKEARLSAYEAKFGTEDTWDFDDVLEFRRMLKKDETKPPIDKKEDRIPELSK